MNLKLITAATTEPVSLVEAKEHLRVIATDEDTLIGNLVKAARQEAENYTNKALAPQTFELILDKFPAGKIVLPMPPVERIDWVKYKDCDGIETTINHADYILYNSESAIIVCDYGVSWPSFNPYPVGAVSIRFIAGYKTTGSNASLIIPEPIKQAILLIIGDRYENRENIIVGQTVTEIPNSAKFLLYPYRVW
ncbi:MAG: head-tail connector protein [Actinobacteria bacterium]|nr:head-tail connector protein [Actinomycetota bacterium]